MSEVVSAEENERNNDSDTVYLFTSDSESREAYFEHQNIVINDSPLIISLCSSEDNVIAVKEDLDAICSVVKPSVQTHTFSKTKRIHMDSLGCHDHMVSGDGKLALSCPQVFNQTKRANNRLNPVIRHKRQKLDPGSISNMAGTSTSYGAGPDLGNTSFVKASKMYDLSCSQPVTQDKHNDKHHSSQNLHSTKKVNREKNQGSMSKFLTVKRSDENANSSASSMSNSTTVSPTASTIPTKSLMYSPIKKMEGSSAIYISSDTDDSNSPFKIQDSKGTMSQNSVIKKLFSAQKTIDLKSKKTPSQIEARNRSKTKTKYNNTKEMASIKEEAEKYFEGDSNSLNKIFQSDFEDSGCEMNSTKSVRSTKRNKVKEDQYGLLGSGNYPRSESLKVNYFDDLPIEVLENIFCHLPMLDLCLNSNRVCLLWNKIISDAKFVPWKKLYHELKKDHGNSKSHMKGLMTAYNMISPSQRLVSLIRYMKDFKKVRSGNLLVCLSVHKKYLWASSLIKERLTDCLINNEPHPWCVVAVLVIVAHNVAEIQDIIRCLTTSSSTCTSVDILECLYCLATFLYAFKVTKPPDVWNGMHYRLFYALYLYENASSYVCADLAPAISSTSGQQSLFKYSSGNDSVRLTHEQLRIVKHQAKPDEVIKIVAFAGTGKTTTLVRYTQLRPNMSFLLVVYNKSVCEYAKTKFPKNVECRTGHSLAFKDFGRRYGHKLYGIKVYTLTQILPPRKGDNLFIRAKFVMSTLEQFFASADADIHTGHVPNHRINDKTGFKEPVDPEAKQRYVEDAKLVWSRMKDPRDKQVGMTHDGYLKLYQLSKPSLRKYNCLLIDEAQDLTPAITDILLQQPQGKILVGDPHQQIYSFRGAVNAMSTIQADTIFYLTQSFRFGPEIAHVAAICLEVLKKEQKKTLVGSAKPCTVRGEAVGQVAIISRFNFTVFSEAVKKCCYSNEPYKVAFVGGTSNFGFDMLLDMYGLMLSPEERLKEKIEIEHKLIKNFKRFVDLENFATKTMDTELLGKIRIVKTFGNNLRSHIKTICSKCVRDERMADFVFSTAHKSKGLEFSTVRVTDDFLGELQLEAMLVGGAAGDIEQDNPSLPLAFRSEATDEENLLYVAVTRAKNSLQLSRTLLRVLQQGGETFRYPVLSSDLTAAGVNFKCTMTGADFTPQCLTLQRQALTLANGTSIPSALYSPAYLTEDFSSFSSLLGLP